MYKDYDWLKHFRITGILSLILYLITSFSYWDIAWIRNVPYYDPCIRAMIAIVYVLFHGVFAAMRLDFYKEDSIKKSKT